ncbi:hypothetical protein TNCV_4460031 [Trichonephila clavipes]|nr:hypothetical protein TNCV_4460031 [Trichonephila clavipes]
MTPELAPPLLTYTPYQQEDVHFRHLSRPRPLKNHRVGSGVRKCLGQVVSLTRNSQCSVPDQASYSFIDPLKRRKAELTLPSPGFEPWTCDMIARYTSTQPPGCRWFHEPQ